jgi:ABC-2 type transport system ATP-binding protein
MGIDPVRSPGTVADRLVQAGLPVQPQIDVAIQARDLEMRYRKKIALRRVNFCVPSGCICGFLGPNGAGKTTTIRLLMGLLKPTSGNAIVLGLDPLRDSFQLRHRVGYVPDVSHIYHWMSIDEVFRFAASVYRNWDSTKCKSITNLLQLPTSRTVKQLSRGELAKLNLVIAMSHRPQLLILDEPTTGVDPLMRGEFLDAVVGIARAEGTTVFFSTHILSDVDRIADRIIVINEGHLIADDTVEALQSRYTKASFIFSSPPRVDNEVPGALRVHCGIREWVAIFDATDPMQLQAIARRLGAEDVLIRAMTVEDIFIELFNHRLTQSNGA